MAANQRSGVALQSEIQLGSQPRSAQQAKWISQQVGFAQGPQLALGEILQPTGGIEQPFTRGERKGEGIDAVITPLQIVG